VDTVKGSHPGAVVLNGSPSGLCVVRSLGQRGILTALIRTKENQVARASRWTEETQDVLSFRERPAELLDVLDHRKKRWAGRVLIPASDRALEFLSCYGSELSAAYRIASPPSAIALKVLEKDRTLKAASEIGVDVPRVYGPANQSTLSRTDIAYPVLVKPVVSHQFTAKFNGHKLFVANDPGELTQAVERLDGMEASIIDFVPGADDQLFSYSAFLDQKGTPVAEFAYRKIRKSPPVFGVARVAETWDGSALRERTLELLRHLGWTGLATVEYKRDSRDGGYRLIEINGRSWLSMGLAVRSGIDYPFLTWCQGAGLEPPRLSPNDWDGVWLDLRAELLYNVALRKIEGRSWKEIVKPYRRKKTYAVWSTKDPGPGLMQAREVATFIWQRARKRKETTEGFERFRGPAPPPLGRGTSLP